MPKHCRRRPSSGGRGILLLLLLLCFSRPLSAADKWVSIRSKNFLLAGNASESDIRKVDRTLEEFRSALAAMFPRMDQASSVPTTVVVFKNDESFKPFKPAAPGASNTVAFFQPGEDVNYIGVTAMLGAPSAVLHEYAHFLLKDNVAGLPLWIVEGLAECYSTFDLGGKNDYTLGRAPETHVTTFSQPQRFMSIKQLLAVGKNSTEYKEQTRQGVFYAESWAFVHYLVLGADGKRRNQFTQLMTALAKGEPFEDSFGEAFQTDYGTLEEEVRAYIQKKSSWGSMKVVTKDTLQVDARPLNPVTLTEGESEAYLGDLLLHLNRIDDAETHLNTALSKSPNLLSAQGSLAIVRVKQKKYDEALSLLKKAVDADSKNPMIHFYLAYVLERAESDATNTVNAAADRIESMRTYAKKAIELSPRFVESYALLARADLNAGEHLDEAEATLKKAISISPGRDDLQLLLAQTYLRSDRRIDARTVLSNVERTASDFDTKRRATALLDQTEQAAGNFAEIVPPADKTATPSPEPRREPSPPRAQRETILEALTPLGPDVQGEKVNGLLIDMDCTDGLTFRVRTDKATLELHSPDPDKIQFLSYTSDVNGSIKCGPRNPGTPVAITYRPVAGGRGEPLVVEFLDKK